MCHVPTVTGRSAIAYDNSIDNDNGPRYVYFRFVALSHDDANDNRYASGRRHDE